MKVDENAVAGTTEEDSAEGGVDTGTQETETEETNQDAEETGGESDDGSSDESDNQDADSEDAGDKGEKLFNDEQQKVFEKRVGKEIEKRKALEQKVQELESNLNETKSKSNPDVLRVSESIGIPAAYLNESESKLLAEYDKWVEVRNFCRAHKDGCLADGKEMTSDDIAAWRERASDELLEIAPEAKSLKKEKARQFAEDAALGRKLRLERSSAVQKKNIEAKKPVVANKPVGGMAPAQKKTSNRIMSGEEFKKAGGNEAAVRKFFSAMVPID